MFTQSVAYIRKPDANHETGSDIAFLIAELMVLGYTPMYYSWNNNVEGKYLVCEQQTWHCTGSNNKPDAIFTDDVNLFLALAALRNDHDQYQWFRHPTGEVLMCECQSYIDMWGDFEDGNYPKKLTADELVEYFKLAKAPTINKSLKSLFP